MENLNKRLYDAAKENGCCEEWLGYISKASKEELLDLYKKGIDFSILHPDWFTNDFVLENFTPTMLSQHCIFINSELPSLGHNGVYIIKGSSFGSIRFDRFAAATIYVLEDCDIDIECYDFANVFIHVYGRSGVSITQHDVSKVYVYKHKNTASVKYDGEVRIREEKVGD